MRNTTAVAIFGLGLSARDVHINMEDCQVWAMPWDPEFKHAADILFDLHPLELSVEVHGEEYLEYLKRCGKPIFMQNTHPDIVYADKYPVDAVSLDLGRRYFGSSPAYMIAYAIFQEIKHIRIYGVDLSDSIYDHQRPNLEWLIGLGEGRGHTFYVEPGGKLFNYNGEDRLGKFRVRYPEIYGFDPEVLDADV